MANGRAFFNSFCEAFVGGACPDDLEEHQLCLDAIPQHHVQLYFGTSKPLSCWPVEGIRSPRRQTLIHRRKGALGAWRLVCGRWRWDL